MKDQCASCGHVFTLQESLYSENMQSDGSIICSKCLEKGITKDTLHKPKIKDSPENAKTNEYVAPDVIFEQLRRLGKLRDSGILTEQEFTEQKKKFLEKLS